MIKKLILAALVLNATALVMVGCGSSDTSDAKPVASQPEKMNEGKGASGGGMPPPSTAPDPTK